MKKNVGLYEFLDMYGVLEHGTQEDIAKAKKQYWLQYKREWKKAKRKECKSFEILLNAAEFKFVAKAAARENISPTNFIKHAALSYNNTQILITPMVIGEMRQLLIQHYNAIQTLTEENTVPIEFESNIINQAMQLEESILHLLDKNKSIFL